MISEKYNKLTLRLGISLVFLYFGFQQVYNPDKWISFVPSFFEGGFLSANNFVVLNGIVELTLGLFLIIGLYVRFSSFILALHLFGIAFSIGLTPTGVRDFGLAVATTVLFLYGPDRFSLDYIASMRSVKVISK